MARSNANKSVEGDNTNPGTGEDQSPSRRGRRKGEPAKNFVGTRGEGEALVPFSITDSDSIGEFVEQYGDMGVDWKKAGYETHFNNFGPLQRHGVDRMTNQGKVKTLAIFADSLAETASYVGDEDYEPSKGGDPEEAEQLLASFLEYLQNLIETKREQSQDRRLEAAAKAAGVSVEDLRALRSRTKQNA